MEDMMEIGIIAGGHGLRGEIKFYPYSDNPQNLLEVRNFHCEKGLLKILTSKINGRFIVIKTSAVNDRETADSMKGLKLYIHRQEAKPLKEGVYYISDIIGCAVFEEEEPIGIVDDVMRTGSNDVYAIKKEDGSEILLPALKDVILKVDIEGKRIDIRIPEGLVDGEEV